MIKQIFIVLLLTFSLFGCLQTKMIERLGIINTRGVDIIDDNKIETTLVIFKFDAETKSISQTVTGVGHTIKKARENANYGTSIQLTPGQIKLELYGTEAAESGLMRYLDTLVRDARVSDTMFLAVSDTTASELITTGEKEVSTNIGQYLHDIIEQSINDGLIPRTTLQDFMHLYYDVGQDPFLPVLALKDDKPTVKAIAIFQDDKQVGTIPIDKAFLLNMFNKTIKTVAVEFPIPLKSMEKYLKKKSDQSSDTLYSLFTVLEGTSKTKMTDVKNLHYETEINLDLSLMELSEEVDVKSPKVIHLLEKEIEKEIKHQYEQLLAKMKDMNADPFGYGNIYRVNKESGKLKKSEWRDKFPDIEVDYKVNVRIIRHGTIP